MQNEDLLKKIEALILPMREDIKTLDKKVNSLDEKIDSLDKKFGDKITALDKKIDSLDKKFDKKFDSLDNRVNLLDKKFEDKITTLDMKIDVVHEYQKRAQGEIADMFFESNEGIDQGVKILTKRVVRIEKHLDLPPLDH